MAEAIQAYYLWKSDEMTLMAMQEIGVKKKTFYKLVKEYDRESKSIHI
jgi:hypothetical protein